MEFPATARPDEEFHDPLDVAQRHGIRRGIDERLETRNQPVFPLKAEHQRHRTARPADFFQIGAPLEDGRLETRIERCGEGGMAGRWFHRIAGCLRLPRMPVSGRFHVFPADGPAGGPGRWAVSNKPPRGWTK